VLREDGRSSGANGRPSATPRFPAVTVALGKTGGEAMKYKVHHFNIRMTRDQTRLEEFLNGLKGEVVAIIPNVTPFPATFVDFVLVVEKIG
jgi:hypothetical protein